MKLKHNTVKFIIGLIITAVVVAGLIFALPGIWDAAVYLLRLFMPFVIAYIFALAVDPLVRKMQKNMKLPRSGAAFLVMVILIGGIGGLLSWIIYKLVNEIRTVYDNFPDIYDSMVFEIELIKTKLSGIYDMMPPNIQETLQNLADEISVAAAGFINKKSTPVMNTAGSLAKSLPNVLVSTLVFLLSSYFMISDFARVKKAVKTPFTSRAQEKLTLLGLQIKKYLGAYVKAQLMIMSVVFFILFIGLSILNVEYALLVALGTAVLDALPFFGSGAVLWPWSLISFVTGDLKMGIGAVIIYVVIVVTRQSIEPKIVSSNIGMNPILTLMSMYLGFKLLSIGGMILGPVIMMLIISLYKAKIFDTPIELLGRGKTYMKKQLHIMKLNFKKFWESE